jgi:hypothetical protein
MGGFTLNDIRATRKSRDSWWTVFLVDPPACRLTLLVANHTAVTPNGLTRLSLLLGLASAASFAYDLLVAGAALFYVSFMVDCMDGKLARLKGTGTPFGLWLDYVGDRFRVVACAFGLAFGQYAKTGEMSVVLAAIGVVVLDLFRYINGPQLKRVREATREAVIERMGPDCVFAEDILRAGPRRVFDHVSLLHDDDRPFVDLQRGFRARFPWFDRIRRFLVRHRVRSHVIGGIEFHAAVFVVSPLFGPAAFVPVSIGAGALLLAFEISLVYRVWLATREIPRVAPDRNWEREKVLV